MLDSIFAGMSGLLGYSRGLRNIANNTANMNTPGYKSSQLQFAEMFNAGNNGGGINGSSQGQAGYGLNTLQTTLNFTQGELRQTGGDTNLAVDGQGLFMIQDSAGQTHYTRDGQFHFDVNGTLVTNTDGAKVMGIDADGKLTEITFANQRTNPAKATTSISITGNLSSTATTVQTVSVPNVLDATGGAHTLTLQFTNNSVTTPGSWSVAVLDSTTTVGTGTVSFNGGVIDPATAKLKITYTPPGQAAMDLTFDLSSDLTSFSAQNNSNLTAGKPDGYVAGGLSTATFDASGQLVLAYSNAQTVKGVRLALGKFNSPDAVVSTGGNEFDAVDPRAWQTGTASANGFGAVRSGVVEISNVDLSQQFSDLVIMQRGYQASSQIVSTANDMLQELFTMKSK
jgi:flagellar hook protein FlgE